MTEPFVALALWLATLSGVIYSRICKRKRSHLEYGYNLPQSKGLAGGAQAFGRAFETMTWGSSLAMWRVRCEASLKASRRRRGLHA